MREEIVMELSSKFYIIALSVVLILTLLSVLGIVILGRGHPESRLNRNFSKIMIAVVAVGALSAGIPYTLTSCMERSLFRNMIPVNLLL